MLQAQGLESGHTGFFEGDDRAVIDGELAVPGTGSEDSFNGGWYDVPGRWETRTSLPLSGCLDYRKPLARTGGYRFFLTDSYAYGKSIDYTIEHGPEGNAVPTDYASVVFFYSLEPPAGGEAMRPAAERRVRAWTGSSSFRAGTSHPHDVHPERDLDEKCFGDRKGPGPALRGEDERRRHLRPAPCLVHLRRARSRALSVSVKAIVGPDQGILRVYERDRPAGQAVNL